MTAPWSGDGHGGERDDPGGCAADVRGERDVRGGEEEQVQLSSRSFPLLQRGEIPVYFLYLLPDIRQCVILHGDG